MVLLRQGLRVGLLGGSFDPPHEGHLHLSREALKRFGLDHVIWLVSPGNPLKADAPTAMARRMTAARDLQAGHPRLSVSDFEARAGSRYTADTLRLLRDRHPCVRFVWLMGADNLAQLHRWQDWRDIMDHVPVGVLARPGDRMAALNGKAARIYRGARLPAGAAAGLGRAQVPKWCFLNMPMVALSSSKLRAAGQWKR